jgi:hypothetical protein
LPWRILEHGKAGVHGGQDGDPARVPQLERGFDVLGNEEVLDHHDVRPVLVDDLFQLFINLLETYWKRLLRGRADAA